MQRQDMGKEREGERELTLREPLDTTRSEARSTLQVFRYISQKVFFFFLQRLLGCEFFLQCATKSYDSMQAHLNVASDLINE